MYLLATYALLSFAQFTLGGLIPPASADVSKGTTEQQVGSNWAGHGSHSNQVDPIGVQTGAILNKRGLVARQNSISELEIRKIVLEKQLKAVTKVRSELAQSINEILSNPKLDSATRQAQVSAMLPVLAQFTTQQSQIKAELASVNAAIGGA